MTDKSLKTIGGFKDIPMPNPTEEMRNDPKFEVIWNVIKSWDVNVSKYYDGYCGANGSHVALIMEGLKDL